MVLLSVRDPESWYRSASNTIFLAFDRVPPEMSPWMAAVRRLLHDRFSDRLDDPTAMMDAYERHNEEVRDESTVGSLIGVDARGPMGADLRKALLPGSGRPLSSDQLTSDLREMIGLPPRG